MEKWVLLERRKHTDEDVKAFTEALGVLIRREFIDYGRNLHPRDRQIPWEEATDWSELHAIFDVNMMWVDAGFALDIPVTDWMNDDDAVIQFMNEVIDSVSGQLRRRPLNWFDIGICFECGGLHWQEIRPGFFGYMDDYTDARGKLAEAEPTPICEC